MADEKNALVELKGLFEEFKQTNDQREAEIKKYGEALSSTVEKLEKMNSRMDELETKLNRPAQGENKEVDPEVERKQAFDQYLRKGIEVLVPEKKALVTYDDTLGGYLAPGEYVREIIKGIVEFSPIRSVASIRQTSQRFVELPKKTGSIAAVWVAETGTRSETTGMAYGLENVPVHEMSAVVDISFADLEDSAFNMEEEIVNECSEQFGVAEGTAFVSGNAIGKPQGILTNEDIDYTASGDADEITADGLMDIFYDLKSAYANNAVWLLNRQTLKAIRKLKAGDGHYLWQPNIGLGTPPTICERPYIECVDMPDIAANAYPIVLGDFKRGYKIIDRIAISITRDNLTQASSGKCRFTARKRVGGQVVLAEAIRKLKIATS
ncbi:MAG: phage major capsid protein [Dehalococcoidia bacterium]|nr:phage major capsid protein [Dehalococcoidia bacterium]